VPVVLEGLPALVGVVAQRAPHNFFIDPGRIHVGSVKKVDAALQGPPDERAAFLLFQDPLDLQRVLLRG
jgi:hypothetical protein